MQEEGSTVSLKTRAGAVQDQDGFHPRVSRGIAGREYPLDIGSTYFPFVDRHVVGIIETCLWDAGGELRSNSKIKSLENSFPVLKLLKDTLCIYGVLSTREANFTLMQHFIPALVPERALSLQKHRTKVA